MTRDRTPPFAFVAVAAWSLGGLSRFSPAWALVTAALLVVLIVGSVRWWER